MPANLGQTPWTPERIDLLKILWADKLSCSLIATEINDLTHSAFTRCSIIGKARRLGLDPRVIIQQKPRLARKPRERRVRWKPQKAPELVCVELPADFLGIPFFDTTDKTCIYPEGEGAGMLFCGQPKRDGSSYCAGHHRVVWVKPDRKPSRYAWKEVAA